MLNQFGFNDVLTHHKQNAIEITRKNKLLRRYRHDQPFTLSHNKEDYNE